MSIHVILNSFYRVQISKMSVQQQILNQLQSNIVDELESKGAFEDPETREIVERYKIDAKKVEDNLRNQRQKQQQVIIMVYS